VIASEEMTMVVAKSPEYKLNNGIGMPAFGLGVFHSEPEQTVSAVSAAITEGYRLIDTASFYQNEEEVGQGIRASGISREEVFVTTKLWMTDYGYEQTPRAFERSLRKLGLDFLDLYLIHWPVPSAFESTVASYKAAMDLLADGRVRAIGVCNFGPADLRNLIGQTGHVPAVNQIELHPFFSQRELRYVDHEHGIITQAWSPIGGVNRYGMKASKEGVRDPLSHPTLVALATKYGKTAAQIVLRWHIEIGSSPIPKSARPERIKENIDVFDFSLSADEVQAIESLDTGERGGPDPAKVSPEIFSAAPSSRA
jgi:diketogulonate reductase-like aldo/keto reductase